MHDHHRDAVEPRLARRETRADGLEAVGVWAASRALREGCVHGIRDSVWTSQCVPGPAKARATVTNPAGGGRDARRKNMTNGRAAAGKGPNSGKRKGQPRG